MFINKQKGKVGTATENDNTEIVTPLSEGEVALNHNTKTLSVGSKSGNIVIPHKDYSYSQAYLDNEFENYNIKNIIQSNATSPFGGYMEYVPKKDNFVFEESTAFAGKVGDKNRYLNFNGHMVDTYGPELVTNGDFSDGTAGWNTNRLNFSIEDGMALLETNSLSYSYWTLDGISGLTVGSAYEIKLTFKSGTSNMFGLYSGGYLDGYNYTDSQEDGVHSVVFVANSTVLQILGRYFSLGETRYFSNISVREIQTADLSDMIPNVTVQDQATNGLNVQSAVSAGDFVVVDREELVTNGTFSTSDISGFPYLSGCTLSVSSEQLVITSTSSSYCEFYMDGLIGGKEYVIKFDFIGGDTNTKFGIYCGGYLDGWGYTESRNIDSYAVKFIANNTRVGFVFDTDVVGAVYTFDNISVKQVDESYRAIQDAPSGTELTNTSYFENRDKKGIYNQVAVLHKYNPAIRTYLGMTSEILFDEMLANETTKGFMIRNGYGVVAEGVYSKDGYWYIVAGVWNSLNKGAYHPDFNPYGCANFYVNGIDAYGEWYQLGTGTGSFDKNSVAGCFIGRDGLTDGVNYATGYVSSAKSGRPGETNNNTPYYDIVYPNQFIDMREYAFNPTAQQMKDRVKELELEQISGDVVTIAVDTEATNANGTRNIVTISGVVNNKYLIRVDGNITLYPDGYYNDGYIFNVTKGVGGYINGTSNYNDANDPYFYIDPVLGGTSSYNYNWSVGDEVIFWKTKQNTHLSQGTRLHTDIIGDPANYPSSKTDRLAEGKPLIGQYPLLVDDSGNSLIPDGNVLTPKLSSKAPLIALENKIIYSDDSGATYSLLTGRTNSVIDNTLNVGGASGALSLASYTAQNTTPQSDPKQVIDVEPKVISTNSHSIYKGSAIGNCIGKVLVGNGSNGYESKYLENSEVLQAQHKASSNYSRLMNAGEYIINYNSNNDANGLYKVILSITDNPKTTNLDNTSYYKLITTNVVSEDDTFVCIAPIHSTLNLDNSTDTAVKWFNATTVEDNDVFVGRFLQETKKDGSDNWNSTEFDNLTNGTTYDDTGTTQVKSVCINQFSGFKTKA
jgi:hypothetical protein